MAELTDKEITEACARAVGMKPFLQSERLPLGNFYNPLQDDAQAMALVKKCGLSISGPSAKDKDRNNYVWAAFEARFGSEAFGQHTDLNRAICLCAARVQIEKEKN